jgi:manganese transport protein
MNAMHDPRSLPEVHASVPVPQAGTWLRRLLAFAGPAYLVSVGYMDPGNWATDLAGGSRFGYQLVWVLVLSNLMAVLLQTLAARLGVVTGKDLAQACRDFYPRPFVFPLWVLCEVAIIACDLAEVLGAAIGLKLLFGVPLLWGVLITAADVLLLLALSRYGMRRLEAFIVTLVATMGGCFAVQMLLSQPDVAAIFAHVIPRDAAGSPTLFAPAPGGGWSVLGLHGDSLFIAMGILGATVMPHNLYLHSSLVQSRAVAASAEAKRQACRMNLVDTVVALNAALFVNGAILVLAAAVFHRNGIGEVASIEQAHSMLAPLLGTSLASTLFAVALLCSGQASTITGTLAGQIVMEGFLRIRLRPWLRRLISRALAIVPAALVIATQGERAVDMLLVLSQVVLSLQLSFAVIPLVTFTSDRRRMGEFVNPVWVKVLASIVVAIIAGLNGKLVVDTVGGWIANAGPNTPWVWATAVPLATGLAALLAAMLFAPVLQRWWPRLRPALAPEAALRSVGAGQPAGATAPVPALALPARAYRRIAVALDRGRADDAVLAWLRAVEFAPDARLVLVHVVESAAGRYLGPEASDAEMREDRDALEAVAASFRERGVQAEVQLGFGDPAHEIARLAEETGADLLVTGSHGHTGLRDVLYGTTVSAVRHRVRCPVFTIPMAPRG